MAKAKKEVLIVGGGISGLAAANQLARSMDVTLLEARGRLGGRIHTDRSWNYPIDLGAQVIHGFQGNPVSGLSKRLGLKTLATDWYDYHVYGPDGKRLAERDVKRHEEVFEKIAGGLRERTRRLKRDIPAERAVDDALRSRKIPPLVLAWLKESHAIYSGSELSNHSAKEYWQDNEFEGPNRMFPEGYDGILKAFRDLGLVRVLLKHPVKELKWSTDGVSARTARGTFTAEAALVTLPVGVLQSGTVSFQPGLPSWKTRAINKLGMGVLDMLYLEFPRVFWPKDRDFLGILGRTGEFSRFVNHYRTRKIPLLAGFAGGDAAKKLERLSTEQAAARAMKSLETAFGPDIPRPVRAVLTRWASDPWSRGSYSFIPPGASLSDYDILARPVAGRLFFAGEATIPAHPTTVHGAYLSGLREAARIRDSLPLRRLA